MPVSKLDSDSDSGRLRLLHYLVSGLHRIEHDNMKTFFTYGEVHTALGLELHGNTVGTSLQNQGLNALGAWAMSNKKQLLRDSSSRPKLYCPAVDSFRSITKRMTMTATLGG
jgi:hypothetical protein